MRRLGSLPLVCGNWRVQGESGGEGTITVLGVAQFAFRQATSLGHATAVIWPLRHAEELMSQLSA